MDQRVELGMAHGLKQIGGADCIYVNSLGRQGEAVDNIGLRRKVKDALRPDLAQKTNQ